MREDEESERHAGPEPALFDKVDIEDVALLGEVRRRRLRWVVGLVEAGVGACSGADVWCEG